MDEQNPYRAPTAGLAASGLSTGHYEFEEFENATLERTGKRARTWGIICILIGILAVGGMALARTVLDEMGIKLPPNLETGIYAVLIPIVLVELVSGWLYIAAGSALLDVVQTSGNDIELLMTGLHKMSNAFAIEVVMKIVGFIAGAGLGAWFVAS